MLEYKDLFRGNINKVDIAIDILKTHVSKEGFHLADSGGKDSGCIKALANIAGVKYDAHYCVTTIDPPDLVYFIRKFHSDTMFDLPDMPFLTRMVQKGFPQRQRRWCCAEYKEKGGSGRRVVTGIRKAESYKRSKRKSVEFCFKDSSKIYINPIIDWEDSDVWEFTKKNSIPYCKLYDMGFKRLGCLFCPMASSKMRKFEMELYPGYAQAFKRAFCKLYKKKKDEGKTSVDRWKDGIDMFNWWIEDSREKHNPDQCVLFE